MLKREGLKDKRGSQGHQRGGADANQERGRHHTTEQGHGVVGSYEGLWGPRSEIVGRFEQTRSQDHRDY